MIANRHTGSTFNFQICCLSVRISENDLYLLILHVCTAINFTTFNCHSLTGAQWLMLVGNQYLIDTLLEPDDHYCCAEFQLVSSALDLTSPLPVCGPRD